MVRTGVRAALLAFAVVAIWCAPASAKTVWLYCFYVYPTVSNQTSVLAQLIARLIDPNPALRKRMRSAILLGGNVIVKNGEAAGGTFEQIPACRSAVDLGCVIAFSTFDQPPPADSTFGRTGVPDEHVLCTNPAALLGARTVAPIFPSRPFAPGTLIASGIALLHLTQPMPATVWVSEPGALVALVRAEAAAFAGRA